MNKRFIPRGAQPRRNALVMAVAIGLGFSGFAYGQATNGSIFGTAPAGESVTMTSAGGVSRTVTANENGRFSANLPVGTYTVTLSKDGETVTSRNNVTIAAGAGTEVDFATELATVQVNASALPSIDVSSAASSMTVTAAQLAQLPLARSAEAIALLAPGVVQGSGYFGNSVTGPVITFAGAGATENAYYVNGFNTTSLYNYTGAAYQLPYGSIDQQQTIVGGYDAKYGRSDGGVLSQIGKRGTNEWHFGGQVTWAPRSMESDLRNVYYPDVQLQPGESFEDVTKSPGDLHRYREENKQWSTTYSVYAGGPLVKDKLFAFVSVDQTKTKGRSVQYAENQRDDYYTNRDLRWYGKIDWNINDSNILEYTRLQQNSKNGYGESYSFDSDTATDIAKTGDLSYLDYENKTDIFQYTSYLSDAATLSILYGKTEVKNPTLVPNPSDLPFISGSDLQNPALNGGQGIVNAQNVATISSPESKQSSKGLRVDFDYRLGDHLLQVGIDNLDYTADNQGRTRSGPGYVWIYNRTKPGDDINTVLNVGAPGGDGYYVQRNIFTTVTSMSASQRAWYVQDKWQITPNLLLQLGLRNDDFTNSNAQGNQFVVQKDQWEPRLGFSWDVNGDSSLKLYGSAGRYYLAIPQATGERAASGSINTGEYFTYTGIDANGIPTGLVPVRGADGGAAPGPVSANNEFGIPPDPKTVTSTNLKPQYQDEYILGFDKTLGADWVYGAKGTYRTVGTVIDDECDPVRVRDKMASMGYNTDQWLWDTPGCRIVNPNLTSNIKVNSVDGTDSVIVPMTAADFGGTPKVQRDYYALDLYLEHPFNGTWMGRVSYTYARSWGNAEGQVRSDIGQTDVSVTEDWDYVELMSSSRGYLANHRKHQLKAYGAWQVTPEWLVAGTALVQSGAPESCLGWFGPEQTNPGGAYGTDYHWCRGVPSPPGSAGTNPWQTRVDLSLAYRPAFAEHKLAFKLDVFNVFDKQTVLQTEPHLYPRSGSTISNTYHEALYFQDPRYMRLSVSYDY
ncbi:TonB-dependent receptor [Frateuria hangzhouensis]|uniref:TonB-dependent receptor n=1 Tax=Frateuria hangzhouensis TaxID=2995589 RepID=UPI00226101C7|nr:TonB-dependent receptor [Frateuria sp. STR12]MCX7513288.1 TonB-dependent receptor [Frateuria sp. STR12]